jgi:hypothetical protein
MQRPNVYAHARWEISPREGERLVLGEKGGLARRCVDIFGLQVRIAGQNCLARLTGGEQTEQPRHGKAQPPYAEFAHADGRVNGDAGEVDAPILPQAGNHCRNPQVAWMERCAPKARLTSGGRNHAGSCR